MRKFSFMVPALFGALLLSAAPLGAMTNIIQVTTTDDDGDGSLRAAINTVNATPTIPNVIAFDALGSGVQTISLLSPLPAITASYTFVDGSTAESWTLNNPVIVLDGTGAEASDCLTISGASNCVVRGLVISNWNGNGISIVDGGIGSNNNVVIGCFIGTDQTGTTANGNVNGISITGSTDYTNTLNTIGTSTELNLISGNSEYGIVISTNVSQTVIQYNYIGTDINGTSAIPNGSGGASVTGSETPIIDEQALGNSFAFNTISGNSGPGISMYANVTQTEIVSNNIGVDITGATALPNDLGLFAQGAYDPTNPDNGVISYLVIVYNIISGNKSHGIYFDTNVNGIDLFSCAIGTDVTGTINLGNGGHGIYLLGATNAPCSFNAVGTEEQGNYIQFNGAGEGGPYYGVLIDGDPTTPSVYNPIEQNNIWGNNSNGIQLLDGSNDGQEPPTIINAVLNNDGNAVAVALTAPSSPASSNFNIDFFINSEDRSPITEGQIWLNTAYDVPSGATVVNLFPLPVTMTTGWVSATATNNNSPEGGDGDTSPFCSNFEATLLPDNLLPIMFKQAPL